MADIAGEREAAEQVELVLPETGVCSGCQSNKALVQAVAETRRGRTLLRLIKRRDRPRAAARPKNPQRALPPHAVVEPVRCWYTGLIAAAAPLEPSTTSSRCECVAVSMNDVMVSTDGDFRAGTSIRVMPN